MDSALKSKGDRMSEFFNVPTTRNMNLKDAHRQVDPVLYTTGGRVALFFILDEPFQTNQQKIALIKLIKNRVTENFTILTAVPFKVKKGENEKSVEKFYLRESIDLSRYIPKYSRIVSFGKSIITVTGSSNLNVEGFYDYVFNDTHFYSPQLQSEIFPVDSLWKTLRHNAYLMDCFETHFLKKQISSATQFHTKPKRIPRITIEEVDLPNKLLKEHIGTEELVAWDLETKGTDEWAEDGRILCMSLSFDGKTGYVLPWNKIDVNILNEFFKGKKGILHNGKFDARWVIRYGVDINNVHIHADTWNGSHLLNEMQNSKLKTDAYLYTLFGGYDNELSEYQRKFPQCEKDYSRIPKDLLYKYAGMDAIVTFQIYEAQQKLLQERYEKLYGYYYNYTMPLVREFLHVEVEGMPCDVVELEKLGKEVDTELEILKGKVFRELGLPLDSFNIDSGAELGIVLEMIGLPDKGRAKNKPSKKAIIKINSAMNAVNGVKKKDVDPRNGIFLTGDNQLIFWERDGYDIAKLIGDYRETSTVRKTFTGNKKDNTGYWAHIKPDGRFHPNFGVMLTQSHRNWCRNINGQNVPKHGRWAKPLRKIFNPGNDFVIDEKDGAGFQLRIGAAVSGDERMREIFTKLSGDMHSMTGNTIFCPDVSVKDFISKKGEMPYKYYRQKAKSLNFGMLFGSSAFSVAKETLEKEWTLKEVKEYCREHNLVPKVSDLYSRAKSNDGSDFGAGVTYEFCYYWAAATDIRKKFFETYPGLEKYIKSQVAFAEEYGYVQSAFGAIRRLPQLLYKGKDDRQTHIKNLQNIAVNSPVQNFEIVLIGKTMVRLGEHTRTNGLKSFNIGQVHDSIVSQTHRNEAQLIKNIAEEAFSEDIPENNGIPMLLDTTIADYTKDQVWAFGDDYDCGEGVFL